VFALTERLGPTKLQNTAPKNDTRNKRRLETTQQQTKQTKQGAELIFYPTAIGSEPHDPSVSSYAHWARAMLGHAAANLTPVVASNRCGVETFGEEEGNGGGASSQITFYGGSFVGGQEGEVLAQVGARAGANADGAIDPSPDKGAEGFCAATFDLEACALKRAGWGVFRDRRPELYGPIVTLDGERVHRSVERGAGGGGLLVVRGGAGGEWSG